MKFKSIIILFLYLGSLHGQGIHFDKKKYLSLPSYNSDELGFSGKLPNKISFRDYCPPILEQKGNSCVGWAVAYETMSTFYNIKLNIKQESEKFMFSFDPYFIYNLIKENNDFECEEPVYAYLALDVLKNRGCKKMWAPNMSSCKNNTSKNSENFSEPFKIKNYYSGGEKWDFYSKSKKEEIFKTILNFKTPIVVGLNTKKSVYNLPSNGLWSFNYNEKQHGGHAVSIIGYDDKKFGGAFEIMNSWGVDHGENGYMWVKYNDLFESGILEEFYIIDFFENFGDDKCLLGNCYDNYSHGFMEKNMRYEGEMKNYRYSNYGIKTSDKLIYAGYFSDGFFDGNGIIIEKETKKMFNVKFKNGDLISHEELGFGSNKISELSKMVIGFKDLEYYEIMDSKNIDSNLILNQFK